MASAWDLISLDRALATLGANPNSLLLPLIPNYVTAASMDAVRWCRRSFLVSPYDELRMPIPGQRFRNDPPRIELGNFPLIPGSIRVQGGRTTCLTITNTDATTNQRATAQLLATGERELSLSPIGLQLHRIASAVATRNTILWGQPASWGFAATASTGGSLAAGVYPVAYSIVSVDGVESSRSADLFVTVPATGQIAATLPDLPAWASGYNLYVGTAGGDRTTETRQNGGTLIVASGTLNAAITTTVTVLATGSAPIAPANLTLNGLAALVVALGASWQATVPSAGLGNFPAAELVAPFTPLGCLTNSPVSTPFGPGAPFDIFLADLDIVDIDTRAGTVAVLGSGTRFGGQQSGSWLSGTTMADGPGGPFGSPVRCRYSAGWPIVPEPIQAATANLVQFYYNLAVTSGVYKSQKFGAVDWEFADKNAFPQEVKSAFSRYKRFD
jgi:hypothetical protein